MNDPKRISSLQAGGPVVLILSGEGGIAPAWLDDAMADPGIELTLTSLDHDGTIDLPAAAIAAVVEVSPDDPRSVERFRRLGEGSVPLIAAAYEPPLAFVRQLVRLGAHDVIPMPIERAELDAALGPIRALRQRDPRSGRQTDGKLVAVVKSDGGVGATALLGQVAQTFAVNEATAGRSACLLDLDLQFGDAAFQLGLQPSLTMADVIAARGRIDGAMLRSIAVTHSSGLQVVGAPREIMPLDALDNDLVTRLVEEARAQFETVFVDLPANWTNWSLSLLAQADVILLVTQLSITSLHRARRQLDLLVAQGLGAVDTKLIVNRYERRLFGRMATGDIETALGRTADLTVANDYETMSEAIDRGVPVSDVRRRCPLARDIAAFDAGIAAALGRER